MRPLRSPLRATPTLDRQTLDRPTIDRPTIDRPTLDAAAATPARSALAKVPALTAGFWVAKLLTTGMGESWSDFLAEKAPWALALAGLGLIIALVRQFKAPAYEAVTYWTAVGLVAVVGTIAADGVHVLGFPLPVVTAIYAAALLVVLAMWRRREGTLSIHSITTRRREAYYWTAVMLSFALGTAAGDLTSFYLGWGFGISIAVFALGMIIPWVLFRAGLINEVAAFWVAYVMTRPLGATIADWLGKPMGVGLGDGPVAVAGLLLAAAMVTYFAISRSDIQEPTGYEIQGAGGPEPVVPIDEAEQAATADVRS